MERTSLFSFVVCGVLFAAGCQNAVSPDPILISQKVSDEQAQELGELIEKHLSAKNALRTESGREEDVALIVSPTAEDFKRYPNYRFIGETESGLEYMFLAGNHATEAALEAMNVELFSLSKTAAVPNNPDCVGNANRGNFGLRDYYQCTLDLVMSCSAGVTTIRIEDEYHTYSNC